MATEKSTATGEGGDAPAAEGPIDIDWTESGTGLPVGPGTALALGGLVVVGLAFLYDYAVLGDRSVLFGYDIGRLQWLWVACLWVDISYVGALAVRDRERTVAFLRKVARRPVALVAGLVTMVVLLTGTLGPVVFEQPTASFAHGHQPPVYTTVPADTIGACLDQVANSCHGTWRFPLGTDQAGKSMLRMTAFGARIVVQLAVVSVTLIVPLATVMGTVAAYVGGRVDRVITTVAETLRTVPALLVFLLWRWIAADGSLFVLVLAFGLINWGNVAIVVRSRALNEVSKDYVMAAEAGGASTLTVVYDHLIPNVSRTAISAAVYQVPLFVTIEATLSFLKFGSPPSFLLTTNPSVESWGRMIGRGIENLDPFWWVVLVPVAALLLTILSLNLLANSLQDILDPKAS